MMFVGCHIQKYLRGSKRCSTHMEAMEDQIQVDWGPNPSNPHALHEATTSLLAQRWKEIKANTFWAPDLDCMTRPTCNGRPTSYRLHLGRSLYGWKDNLMALPMAPVACQNNI
jgi:hypothetical protein